MMLRKQNESLDRDGRTAERTLRVATRRRHAEHIAEVALAGSVAGAAAGALAGAPGAVAGAVIGGLAGALAGSAMDNDQQRESARAAELDDAIGVTSGDMGAASPSQPPSRRSFVSAASAGVAGAGGGGSSPGEGPMGRSSD